jgi:DNA-binding response OmpR family regulator
LRSNTLNNRILIVDDEPLLLDVLSFEVDTWGYQADCAENGWDAIKAISENSYSLVITDQTMPGISGIDFLKKASSEQTCTLSKFLLLTGHRKEKLQPALDSLKFEVTVLEKPLNMKIFKETSLSLINEKLGAA